MQAQTARLIQKSVSQLRQTRQYLDLRKSQWLPRPTLEKIQEKRLRHVITHAYGNVKHYHDLFKSLNLRPSDITSAEDLGKIPILTKSAVQHNFDRIIAVNVDRDRCFSSRTSGSTGTPLTILFDQSAHDHIGSRFLRHYFAGGGQLRDRIAHFTNPHRSFRRISWFNHLGLLRRRYFSVFDQIEHHISSLLDYAPDVIESYPSILWLMAEQLQEKHVEGIHPRSIFCTAELLPQDVRTKINSTFNVELCDQYGSAEFGTFAWECPDHNGYHMDIESVVVEFLKDGEEVSSGEKGEIVVTGLFNEAMPLIRYSVGDVGGQGVEPCTCGRGLPVMKIVEGRADDFLLLPSGTMISPRNINLLEYVNGIAAYRIIQKRQDELLVQVVKGRNFSHETIAQVEDEILCGCLGEPVAISVEIVDEIPRDKSGKIRAVVSELTKAAAKPT